MPFLSGRHNNYSKNERVSADWLNVTLTCVVWYRMCIDGIVVVSFKCIDLDPMLLVSSSAKSACLYRVICQIMYTNEMGFFCCLSKCRFIKRKEWWIEFFQLTFTDMLQLMGNVYGFYLIGYAMLCQNGYIYILITSYTLMIRTIINLLLVFDTWV